MGLNRIKQWVKRHRLFHWEHLAVCVLTMLMVGILAVVSLNLSIFSPFKQAFDDFSITDVYYAIQNSTGQEQWSDDITIVDITPQNSRAEIAETLFELTKYNPKVVAIDVVFTPPHNDDQTGDSLLVDAIEYIPNKVLGFKLTDYDEKLTCFSHCVKPFFADDIDCLLGYVNVKKGINDGCLRTYTIAQRMQDFPEISGSVPPKDSLRAVYSLPYLASCRFTKTEPSVQKTNERQIVYSNIRFPVVSYDSLSFNQSLIRNRLIVLGALKEESDMHITPVGKMSGVEVLAYVAQTSIDHPKIHHTGIVDTFLIFFLICYLSAWAGWFLQERFPVMAIYWKQGYYFLLSAILVWVGFISFIKFDTHIGLTIPFVGMALVERARLHYKWFVTYGNAHKEKKWMYRFTKNSIYHKKEK